MSSSPPPGRPWLPIALVVVLLIIGANIAGYLYIKSGRPRPGPSAAADRTGTATVAAPRGTTPAGSLTSVEELALEQREAGVAALRQGRYARAIKAFEAAIALDADVPDAASLIDVARRLADAEDPEAAEVADAAPDDAPEVAPRPRRRARRVRRAPRPSRVTRAAREAPVDEPDEPQPGLLLVVTDPEGLLVEIDERPREITPARIELSEGAHSVRIRKGKAVLAEREVEIVDGETTTLEQDLRRAVEVALAKPRIADDGELDLVALIDRQDTATEDAPSAEAPTPDLEPTPRSARPRLLVYWPGRASGPLEDALRQNLAGVDVEVLTRSSDFTARLGSASADAVMAAPYVLRQNGLTPSLTASGLGAGFVAVSLGEPVTKSSLPRASLGIVDELGRKRTPAFVASLLGVSKPPPLRRVGKVEDLLPLLQFDMVKAVLLRSRDVPVLEARTQQKLYTVELDGARAPVAVAFVRGGRRQQVEQGVLGMDEDARTALGVESWTR